LLTLVLKTFRIGRLTEFQLQLQGYIGNINKIMKTALIRL